MLIKCQFFDQGNAETTTTTTTTTKKKKKKKKEVKIWKSLYVFNQDDVTFP